MFEELKEKTIIGNVRTEVTLHLFNWQPIKIVFLLASGHAWRGVAFLITVNLIKHTNLQIIISIIFSPS